jgi:hypothetical protein
MRKWLVLGAVGVVVAVGCGDDDANEGSSAGAAGAAVPSGLPCELEDMLRQECWACHGTSPQAGAPMALATRADLMAPAPSDPSRSNAEVSLARMQDAAAPMPPGALPDATVSDVLRAWMDAGMPQGDCDGGGTVVFESVCTSDSFWGNGDEGSPFMHPGAGCIGCHQQTDKGPDMLFGGTVYPTHHEPLDCRGVPDVVVEVIDGDGTVHAATTNASGNFLTLRDEDKPLVTPITARVMYEGRVREMLNPVESGDCNACHTEAGGSGAPGRILLP